MTIEWQVIQIKSMNFLLSLLIQCMLINRNSCRKFLTELYRGSYSEKGPWLCKTNLGLKVDPGKMTYKKIISSVRGMETSRRRNWCLIF